MRREDLEAALLLAPKRVLVRKETFQLRLGNGSCGAAAFFHTIVTR